MQKPLGRARQRPGLPYALLSAFFRPLEWAHSACLPSRLEQCAEQPPSPERWWRREDRSRCFDFEQTPWVYAAAGVRGGRPQIREPLLCSCLFWGSCVSSSLLPSGPHLSSDPPVVFPALHRFPFFYRRSLSENRDTTQMSMASSLVSQSYVLRVGGFEEWWKTCGFTPTSKN